jgi:hypothetical protein
VYLNTDLDLVSSHDLRPLVAAFESHDVLVLHIAQHDDGLWRASLEAADQHEEPEPNIAALLAVAETLTESDRRSWLGCSRREFNIGYECVSEPRVVEHTLSAELLARIAAVRGSVGLTLYGQPYSLPPAP